MNQCDMYNMSDVTRIRDIVQTALATGYLTVQAENQLRELLTTQYDFEDFNAFMALQEAAMIGQIKQESRESREHHRLDKTLKIRV